MKSVMQNAGYAHMGVGHASGKDKAEQAAMAAISSPLLETKIAGAKGVIINITSSPDIAGRDRHRFSDRHRACPRGRQHHLGAPPSTRTWKMKCLSQ